MGWVHVGVLRPQVRPRSPRTLLAHRRRPVSRSLQGARLPVALPVVLCLVPRLGCLARALETLWTFDPSLPSSLRAAVSSEEYRSRFRGERGRRKVRSAQTRRISSCDVWFAPRPFENIVGARVPVSERAQPFYFLMRPNITMTVAKTRGGGQEQRTPEYLNSPGLESQHGERSSCMPQRSSPSPESRRPLIQLCLVLLLLLLPPRLGPHSRTIPGLVLTRRPSHRMIRCITSPVVHDGKRDAPRLLGKVAHSGASVPRRAITSAAVARGVQPPPLTSATNQLPHAVSRRLPLSD